MAAAPARITLRLVQLASLTTSSSSTDGGPSARGVLLALPPTLAALRASAMELAQSSPPLRGLIAQAKAQRRADRTQERKRKKKKTTHATTAATTAAAADDGESDDEPDSEEENPNSLPAYWPFSWRFSIDGGEVRSSDSYSLLVRDRDCIDAELLVREPGGKAWQPVDSYLRSRADGQTEEDLERLRHSPLRPAQLSPNAQAKKAAPRGHAAAAPAAPSADVDMTPSSTNGNTAANGATKDNTATTQSTSKTPTVVNGKTTFICSSRGCNKAATLGPCPECSKLGNKTSFFCSQECYTKNWSLHSALSHPQTAP